MIALKPKPQPPIRRNLTRREKTIWSGDNLHELVDFFVDKGIQLSDVTFEEPNSFFYDDEETETSFRYRQAAYERELAEWEAWRKENKELLMAQTRMEIVELLARAGKDLAVLREQFEGLVTEKQALLDELTEL